MEPGANSAGICLDWVRAFARPPVGRHAGIEAGTMRKFLYLLKHEQDSMKFLSSVCTCAMCLTFSLLNAQYDSDGLLQIELPNVPELQKEAFSLARDGSVQPAAEKFIEQNSVLQSPELYLYATLMYAKAGKQDVAAKTLIRSIKAGMINPAIIDKDRALDTIQTASIWTEVASLLDNIRDSLSSPANFQVSLEPLDQFFQNTECLPDYNSDCFSSFVTASPGAVRDYYVLVYKQVDETVQTVRDSAAAYSQLRDLYTLGAFDSLSATVTDHILKFSNQFLEGTYPPVYLMPGVFTSGGTASNAGLFIGVETFLDGLVSSNGHNHDREEELVARMVNTIFHELMHFQQSYSGNDPSTVLYKIIEEGAATFVTTLITGGNTDRISSEFLRAEANLNYTLDRLRNDLNSQNTKDWVYNQPEKGWPKDIGYQIGAEICRSYYLNADDKQVALRTLLRNNDVVTIIAGSEYAYILE